MIAEFERYHGVVLRDLIVCADRPVTISSCDDTGRVNSFLINRRACLHIKHSAKRVAPWAFTFPEESLDEIKGLRKRSRSRSVWIALVCGQDGVLVLSLDEFYEVNPKGCDATSFIRVDRDKGTMYRVFGTAGRLSGARPRGIMPFINALEAGQRRAA